MRHVTIEDDRGEAYYRSDSPPAAVGERGGADTCSAGDVYVARVPMGGGTGSSAGAAAQMGVDKCTATMAAEPHISEGDGDKEAGTCIDADPMPIIESTEKPTCRLARLALVCALCCVVLAVCGCIAGKLRACSVPRVRRLWLRRLCSYSSAPAATCVARPHAHSSCLSHPARRCLLRVCEHNRAHPLRVGTAQAPRVCAHARRT